MAEPVTCPFDILIHMRRTDTLGSAGAVGLSLAQRLRAFATGLHVVPLSPVAFASPEAVALYVNEAEGAWRDAQQRGPFWQAALDAHALQGAWSASQGDVVESLCQASRWHDLVVVERPQLNPDAPTGWGLVSRTVFGASSPVVVVPERVRAESAGLRIAVAWNQSREAALAIRGALPLLARAEHVQVFEGEPVENPLGLRFLPKLDLRPWLERHGIAAHYAAFPARRDQGAALLDAAHAMDADLVVMGAWGHSRITELVLGGTTRHLFQHSDLPLLVAH
ncbi:universal stress protein [Dokdonella fugitiva]|jgi:hypothetical protein|uniref:Nucleotide-binding universal stress UspA family protein n=1 Tax=Dokdonella fugitiva TaxID=328517 RepID=A0A4R2I3Q9_9GAMM|nr:universal stress protein [Dokdonella fugitiva]MBA8884729.1 hypothetical protein [Dokdonella fugitiva]TCO37688.1 nucleotide-binding universal stress UspA family protein [Dokdonella fugitiva]